MNYANMLVVPITMFVGVILLILWNRQRVKGKILAFMVKKDRSVLPKLCPIKDIWVLFEMRAYELYPDLIRICRFPMGWPAFMQELVPTLLYDEEDAVPLDWITIDNRLERSMELRAALDENWLRKLVEEASKNQGAMKLNFKKALPFILLIAGIAGLVFLFIYRKNHPSPPKAMLDYGLAYLTNLLGGL